MKIVFYQTVMLIGLFTTIARAHEGHDHKSPLSDSAFMWIAKDKANQLTQSNHEFGFERLSASWTSTDKRLIKIHNRGTDFVIVSLQNTREKKTLYVLMSLTGKVKNVNFSGVFARQKRESRY